MTVKTDSPALRIPRHPSVVIVGGSRMSGSGKRYSTSCAEIIAHELDARSSLLWAGGTMTGSQLEAIRQPDVALIDGDISAWLAHDLGMAERKRASGYAGTAPVRLTVRRCIRPVTRQRVQLSIEMFMTALTTLVANLTTRSRTVVFIGRHQFDPRLWPQDVAVSCYEAAIRQMLTDYPDTVFVDPRPALRTWDDFLADHIHLNWRGQVKLATLVLNSVGSQSDVAAG